MALQQILAHCLVAFHGPLGEMSGRQVLGPKPMGKNGPTGPDSIITGDERVQEVMSRGIRTHTHALPGNPRSPSGRRYSLRP
jgi:hypothetical protein